MSKLGTLTLAATLAAASFAPAAAFACMKNSVSAQTPTTVVDGSGTTTTPFTPLPETKTGG